MPAEWTPHERCWMAWPCRRDFWGDNLAATQKTYASVANAIAEFEPVTMLAPPRDAENCRNHCSDKVTVLPVELDDSWMRDNGPNFVLDPSGELGASIFHFNAWGKKHEPWGKDAAVGHRIAEFLGIRTFSSTIYMEGGGINVDGEGTLLVEGEEHAFTLKGLSLGEIGAARITAEGPVANLEDLSDFAGTYVAVEAGAAAVKGASAVKMRNENGVTITLESDVDGAQISLGGQALSVELR